MTTYLLLERVIVAPRQPRLDLLLEPGLRVLCSGPGPLFSLLLPCLTGVSQPRRGRIRLGADDPYRTPELRAKIGSLWVEEPAIAERGSVGDYVERVRQARRSPATEAGQLPLHGDLLGKAAASCNGFERRRIALHLALATYEPRLLVLHEPFAALETGEEELLLRALHLHAQAHAHVIVTSHDPRSAQRLSSDVRVLGQRSIDAPPSGTRTVLLSLERPRDVAALLARSTLVFGTEVDPQRPRELCVHGADDDELGAVITSAVRQSRSQVTEISRLSPTHRGSRALRGLP